MFQHNVRLKMLGLKRLANTMTTLGNSAAALEARLYGGTRYARYCDTTTSQPGGTARQQLSPNLTLRTPNRLQCSLYSTSAENAPVPMSDYGSGDELIQPGKRRRTQDPTLDQYDSIALSILREKFGFENFRFEQAAAIRTILQGENALVVFPTGAGKSLCYQIPGLAFPELDAAGLTKRESRTASVGAGITLVVSPLLALMKDQVDSLRSRGISAACLDSTKSTEEAKETLDSIRAGALRFLYCAPERLNNELFVETMKHAPGGIRLVAIDEAHCISEWGHAFRPDYLKVARFITEIKAERVVCLTATATPRVAEDIGNAFGIEPRNMFRTPQYRPNLALLGEAVEKKEKFPKLLKFLEEHEGPTLVYITTQRRAERLTESLARHGHSAATFHAGLPAEQKRNTQEAFMESRVLIVVATIAFGMGIDKSDIRNIVHYDVPNTIEEYSQQVGRAGRDGKPSTCTVYLCRDDYWIKESFVRGDMPSRHSLYKLLLDVFSDDRCDSSDGSQVLKLKFYELSKMYDVRMAPLGIILAMIELRFGLFRAITPEYSAYAFGYSQEFTARLQQDESPEALAIACHGSKKLKNYYIDPEAIASVSDGVSRMDIVAKLKEFEDEGLIKLRASGVVNRYRVVKPLPATSEEVAKITNLLYAELESRESDQMKRFENICDLLTGSLCYARALSEYFGTSLPGGMEKCGICTHCLTKKPITVPHKIVPAIDTEAINAILEACDVRDDPRFLARVAFGIKSPRVAQLGLHKLPIFGSLEDQPFASLLEQFTLACERAGYRDAPL
ncbi:ATP-dependent DNA helicase recQ [Xylaria sp. CBS 124048]|nr:ATP-dependent DNA helicase recQ [Xylaria sp. CBS 124048]